MLESNDFHPGRSGRDHLRVLALAAEADIPGARRGGARARRAWRRRPIGGWGRTRSACASGSASPGALLGEPELLVLDEPANGLDPAGIHWLRTFIRRFAVEGGTVLISSHVLAEIAQTVDQVVIINGGRLLATVRLDDLAARGEALEETYLELTAMAAS